MSETRQVERMVSRTAWDLVRLYRAAKSSPREKFRREDLLTYIADLESACKILAMLAADEPQFNNPLDVYDAQNLRNRILSQRADLVRITKDKP